MAGSHGFGWPAVDLPYSATVIELCLENFVRNSTVLR